MEFQKTISTAGLFAGGAYCLLKGIEAGVKHAAQESPITLLATGAILFPLSILVGIATKKIFDDMGWQESKIRDVTIYFFTIVSATALGSAAAVGFGITASLITGSTVYLIALRLLCGACFIVLGIENICLSANHPSPEAL